MIFTVNRSLTSQSLSSTVLCLLKIITFVPTFSQTLNPTPFGFFDSDSQFQSEADSMVVFVKRKLGDDILSVELSSKQIWACLEEATCEYSRLIHESKIESELANVLGMPTSSFDLTNVYPRQNLEFISRQADAYSSLAGTGGSWDSEYAYIDLVTGQQDYNIYSDLKSAASGTLLWDTLSADKKSKYRIIEIFHVEPIAAQHYLLNASNITNFLATSFNYESYVNATVFYVLPIFEDVLRRSMLEAAFRVRRSNYSYKLIGSNLRIFPIPTLDSQVGKLFIRVGFYANPLDPTAIGSGISGSFDSSLNGVSGPSNVPLGNIPFNSITQPGRQWIRQYCLALSKEILGHVRSKISSIPIPNAEIQLDGESLLTQAREDKDKLSTQLKEWLANLTHAKLLEQQANAAEQLNKQLKYAPMPVGKAIVIG